MSTSARVKAVHLREKKEVKREKTVSEKLLRYWGTRALSSLQDKLFSLVIEIFDLKSLLITESQPSLFVRGSSRLRTPVSITNAGEGSRTVSCWAGQLYFKLYPSLKFLSSFNSLRIFFSPSRGEIKKFRKFKLKNLSIFLNNSNRKRLCLFASLPLDISKHAPPKYFNDLSW